nr:hypothetical protein [Tanacetum cinerariifolium]
MMANLSKDIHCTGFDSRPPMLDKTDFASWQQRIRLYCWGKKNRVNIFKSTDEGPFQMGIVREPLAEGTEGAPHLGPERPRVYSDLSPEEKDRVVVQNDQGRQNKGQGTNPQGGGAAGYGGVQNRVRNSNPGQVDAIDKDVDEQLVQDLGLNVDNVFQADECDAFDFDIGEAPMA